LTRPLGSCVLLALALSCGCAGAAVTPTNPLVGQPAPPISAVLVSGEGPVKLSDLAGRVAIVDFWATYCAPCRQALPAYQRIAAKYAPEVAVIAVSTDEPGDVSRADIAHFAQELQLSFPVLWDTHQRTAARYRPPAMPTSYLVDRHGTIRYVHPSFGVGDAAVIEREVRELLHAEPR